MELVLAANLKLVRRGGFRRLRVLNRAEYNPLT